MSKINETNYPRRTQANYADTDMLVIQAAGGNTYTTRIEDLREDCQETLAPALNTMRENLATVEGSTASKAYAKGDFLVFGGRLCKAKTSIASGATLVLDTNIELDSVGDELSSISSDLADITTGTITKHVATMREDVFALHKNNKIAQLFIDNLRYNTAFSSDTKIATLEYKPYKRYRFSLYSSSATWVYGFVDTSGDMYITNYAAQDLLYGNLIYITS